MPPPLAELKNNCDEERKLTKDLKTHLTRKEDELHGSKTEIAQLKEDVERIVKK